jgi:hypothetical protein
MEKLWLSTLLEKLANEESGRGELVVKFVVDKFSANLFYPHHPLQIPFRDPKTNRIVIAH